MLKVAGYRYRQGFTLVELLVVIAIIAILLSLLFPLVRSLKDRGETIRCRVQLRHLVASANLYAADQDGEYPDPWRWVWSDGRSGSLWVEWAQANTVPRGQLFPYTNRNEDFFLCPAFKRNYGANPAFSHLTPYVGYSMNEYFYSWVTYKTWGGRPKIHRSQMQRPASLGVFADEGTVTIRPYVPVWINNLCLGVGTYSKPNSHVDSVAAFHDPVGDQVTSGKANVAFADGHAALVAPSESKEAFTPHAYK